MAFASSKNRPFLPLLGVFCCAIPGLAAGETAPHSLSAIEAARRSGDNPRLVASLLAQSEAQSALGQWEAALESARQAVRFAEKSPRDLRRAQAWLGNLYTQTDQSEEALAPLLVAQAAATLANDAPLLAGIHNSLGTLQARAGRDAEAAQSWEQSAKLARETRQFSLLARVTLNQLRVLPAERGRERPLLLQTAQEALLQTAGSERVKLRVALGEAFLAPGEGEVAPEEGALSTARKQAREQFEIAKSEAQNLVDPRLRSLALGSIGRVAETEGKTDEALTLTRQARFLAQENNAAHLLYRWEWQIGRLQKQGGQKIEAIASLRRAIASFRTLNPCGGKIAFSGARDSQPLYYQLADLLLESAADPQIKTREVEVQALLSQARDAVELLKTSELSEYFRDDCVAAGQEKTRNLGAVLEKAAVVYFIPLPDRTEILVETKRGLQRVTAPTPGPTVGGRARRLRLQMQRSGSEAFLPIARELYDRLMRPLEPMLAAEKIETLVFVSDGALRTIPLGALHDGEKFLLERFKIAVAPALTLTDPRPLPESATRVFVGGISEGVAGFAPLDNVPREVNAIKAEFSSTVLLNSQFVKPQMKAQVSGGDFSIVHIASHGEFGALAENSFLLAYDGKVSLGDLERMIRPRQFRGTPVELLVLSACQTAEGDDRAALGLAGIAVKAGARSALASLWSVSDEATATMIAEFYSQLREHPTKSKASALQAAQLKLLRDEKFAHPSFWAPYLLVGNWL